MYDNGLSITYNVRRQGKHPQKVFSVAAIYFNCPEYLMCTEEESWTLSGDWMCLTPQVLTKSLFECRKAQFTVFLQYLLVSYSANPKRVQWAFLPQRSSTSALIEVTDDWWTQLEEGNEVAAILKSLRFSTTSMSVTKTG